MDKGIDSLSNMKGGNKQKWVRENRPMIVWYHDMFGREATLTNFHLTDYTLDYLLTHSDRPQGWQMTKPDKALAMAQIADAGISELRARINTLEDEYRKFLDYFANRIGTAFALMLRCGLDITKELDGEYEPDTVAIESLIKGARLQLGRINQEVGLVSGGRKSKKAKYLSAHPLAQLEGETDKKPSRSIPPPAEKPDLSIGNLIKQGERIVQQQEEQSQTSLALTTKEEELRKLYLSCHPLATNRLCRGV